MPRAVVGDHDVASGAVELDDDLDPRRARRDAVVDEVGTALGKS